MCTMLRCIALLGSFGHILATALTPAGKDKTLEIVVAHFNENISWLAKLLQEDQVAKDAYVAVYAKGSEQMELKSFPDARARLEYLPNVGREAHTYLSHIVQNYDQLAR